MKASLLVKVLCPKCNSIMLICDNNIVKCVQPNCELYGKEYRVNTEIELEEIK